jgi:hypothetical protein
MGARHWLVWVQLGLLVAPAVPPSAGALATEAPARTENTLTDEIAARRELVTATFQWLEATLARDFAAQSRFYPERMDAFYLWRDVPKTAVIAEKRRVFEQARTLNIRIDAPQLLMDPGARSGRLYFRKTYVIKGRVTRTGEVLQELRWVKEADGWKIISERDLRVIRRQRRQSLAALYDPVWAGSLCAGVDCKPSENQ